MDAREDGKCVCVCMYVYVYVKDRFRQMVETVKNEIEPRERFLYEVCACLPVCG